MKHPIQFVSTALLSFSLAACTATSDNATPAQAGMANPASEHCTETLGGTLEIRSGQDDGQYGVCHLPDGRACEEWALFRDEECILPAAD